jgi:monoamine oxidase
MITWAGSETATSWAGFAEGSIEAGLRAAHEIGSGLSTVTGVA